MAPARTRPTKGAEWVQLGVTLRLLRSQLGLGYRAFVARLGLQEGARRTLEDLEHGGHGVSESRLRTVVVAVEQAALSGLTEPTRRQFLAQAASILGLSQRLSAHSSGPYPVSRLGIRDGATFQSLLAIFDRLPPSEAVEYLEVLERQASTVKPAWAGEAAAQIAATHKATGDYTRTRGKAEAALSTYGSSLTLQTRWDLIMQSGIASMELREYEPARRSIHTARGLERHHEVRMPGHLEPAQHWLCRIEMDVARADTQLYDQSRAVGAARGLGALHTSDPDSQWHPFWASDALLDCVQFGHRVAADVETLLPRQLDLAENLKRPPGTEELYMPLQRLRAAWLHVDKPFLVARVKVSPEAIVDILESGSQQVWRSPLSYGLSLLAEIERYHGRSRRAIEAVAAAYALNRNQRLLLGMKRDVMWLVDAAKLTDADWQKLSDAAIAGDGLFRFVRQACVDEPLAGLLWLRGLQRRR